MCGRYFNHLSVMHDWVKLLKDWPADAHANYNISPTAQVPIFTPDGMILSRWGLIPSWAKEFTSKYPTHNVRIETAHEKPTYRTAWEKSQTCLVPMNGYYEWTRENGVKQPYAIHIPNDLIVCAGLMETWNDQTSFSILTTEASDTLSAVHHRMPVMLDQEYSLRWLEHADDTILACEQHRKIEHYRVSRDVNASRNHGAYLIEPLG